MLFQLNANAYYQQKTLDIRSQQYRTDSLQIQALIDSANSIKKKNFIGAIKLSNKAIEKARATNSKVLLKTALYRGAMLNWYDGRHNKAIVTSREVLALSAQLKDTTGMARSYSLLGLVYLYKADYDSSLANFDKAILHYNTLKDTTQLIKNLEFKGLIYNKMGDYVLAKEILLSTTLLKRQFSNSNWFVLDISKGLEVSRKYFTESLLKAEEGLFSLKQSGDTSIDLRDAYHNVGLSYLKLNYPDSALVEFKKSAAIARLLNIDVYWNEQSRAYANLGFYDSAILCNKKAIANSLDHGTRISLANGYDVLGSSYKLNGNNHQALIADKKALALHKKMGHKHAQMELMLEISELLVKINQLNKALAYTDSAINIANRIKTKKGLEKALKSQFNILKLKGNYKKALEIKAIHDVLLDSLQTGKVKLDLAKLDLYHEVELSKLEISDLNKQQVLTKANLESRTLIMVLVLIISLFIVLLLVFNFFRTNKLRKLNRALNKQQEVINSQIRQLFESNREKGLLLGEIHHRVKNNLQTIASLLNIQQRKLKDPESIKVLEDSKNRVMAMGLMHQHLYQDTNFAEIDFKNYTKELIHNLISTNASYEIIVKCSIPDLKINLDNAIFFGLIINELVINSIKHAYKGVENPLLIVSIFEENNKTVLLVKDNGLGKNISFEKNNSFGWKMVNNICDKLYGKLTIDNTNGLAVKILFSKDIISLK